MAIAQAAPHELTSEVAPRHAVGAAGSDPGLDISIRTGNGEGSTLLSAFDAALHRAGVADFNLVTLSSVIPTGSRIRSVDAPLPGGHGDLLFCVRAEAFADRPGQTAWAGLGWCVDGTGGGLFVEHHGDSEAAVADQITRSLEDMKATRGGGYGAVQMAVAAARCTDLPTCALVLAAYRVSTWHDDGPEPRSDAAPGGVRTPDHGAAAPVAPAGVDPAPDVPAATTRSSGHPPRAAHGPMLTGVPALDAVPAGWAEPAATSTTPSVAPAVRVTMEREVDYTTALRYHDLYQETFGAMETVAAARQLLHRDEFLAEMLDPRVQKYVAWNEHDQAIGMSTLTSDLDTVPWISPGYFAHRYPEQAARGALFYLGFILVDPDHRGSRTFHAMFKAMLDVINAVRGVVAYDVCLLNEERGLLANGGAMVRDHATMTIEEVDRQTYYAATFHGPPTAATHP